MPRDELRVKRRSRADQGREAIFKIIMLEIKDGPRLTLISVKVNFWLRLWLNLKKRKIV